MDGSRVGGGLLTAVGVVGTAVAEAMELTISDGVGRGALVGCALALLVGIALLIWPRHASASPPPPHREDHRVYSVNQSGGVTAHTVNLDTKPRRKLDGETRSGLLRGLPKDKPVRVLGQNGDSEAMAYANELLAFLRANGYPLASDEVNPHMFFDPPVHTIKISKANNDTEWWMVVGPSS